MRSKFVFLFVIVILFFSDKGYSTHIVGGEMRYIHLGNNLYRIHLVVYRDCYNGIPPFDNPASIGIFDNNNILVQSLDVSPSNAFPVVNFPSNCLAIVPGNICYEVATYTFDTNLPPIPGGYQIAYQRCCRSANLTNIVNGPQVGTTYSIRIPDSLYADDNSPVIYNAPLTFVCQNVPFVFEDSAIDADGDSLVYSLCNPLEGASMSNPIPMPPNNPPYTTVSFLSPYSLSNIMGGVPLSIDSHTGQLTGTPNTTGVFAYAVCVKEYRNGIYLSEITRDFQVNVVATVGIEEKYLNNLFEIFPNPIDHSATIKINSDLHLENAELIIYNMLGKEVDRKKNISSHEFTFERNNVVDGIYFFRLMNGGIPIGTER